MYVRRPDPALDPLAAGPHLLLDLLVVCADLLLFALIFLGGFLPGRTGRVARGEL
jgi:hypothetical protein